MYNVVNKTKEKKKEKRKRRKEEKKKRSQLRAIPFPIEHCRLQAVSDNPRRKPTKSVRFRGCFVSPRANSAAILRLFARRRFSRNLPSGRIESSSLWLLPPFLFFPTVFQGRFPASNHRFLFSIHLTPKITEFDRRPRDSNSLWPSLTCYSKSKAREKRNRGEG